MSLKILLTGLLITLIISSFSQTQDGDIRMEKTFWAVKFYEDGNVLKPKEVLKRMEIDPEAFNEFKKAKSNYDAAQVFGLVSGFMIGWPLGTALGGGDPEWGLAAGGAGVLLLSIPLNSAFKKHAGNAIEIYNRGSGLSSLKPYSLQIIPYGAGAKLVLKL